MAVVVLGRVSVISWHVRFVYRVEIGILMIWIHYLHLADTLMSDVADIQSADMA